MQMRQGRQPVLTSPPDRKNGRSCPSVAGWPMDDTHDRSGWRTSIIDCETVVQSAGGEITWASAGAVHHHPLPWEGGVLWVSTAARQWTAWPRGCQMAGEHACPHAASTRVEGSSCTSYGQEEPRDVYTPHGCRPAHIAGRQPGDLMQCSSCLFSRH